MKPSLKFHFLSILLCFLYFTVLAGNTDHGPLGDPGNIEIEVSYTKGSANFGYSIVYVIWIENETENFIQNLYVCNTVLGIGKTLTGTALPYWKMNKYPSSEVDGVTGATQKNINFSISKTLADNSIRQFKIFFEVDHSFDGNDWFVDQPALLYSADVDLDDLQAEYALVPIGWTRNDNISGRTSNKFKDDPPHTSPPIGELQSELRYITHKMDGTGFGDEYTDNTAATNIVGSLKAKITVPAVPLSAKVISVEAPTELITDEIFDVQITMLNDGTSTWGEAEGQERVTLVSKGPDFNTVWGTYFIIKGQGSPVAPGESFTFSAPLRAPHAPGEYSMSWQCQNWIPSGGHVPDLTTIPFFGEIATTSIHVTQRQEVQPPDPVPTPGVISIADFEYVGSFRLPGMDGFGDSYNESGLTLRKVDGQKHLIVGTGTYATDMYEISIPQPVAIIDGNYSNVPVASFVRDWGPIDFGTDNPNGERVYPNCGFWFDNDENTMYWTHYNSYYTGGPSGFPTLASTRFNTDGTTTNLNAWHIPVGYNPFKSYWGGVIKLSDRFATKFTNGRDMAVGFGGYYSICGTASRGPSLGAIARPDPTQSTMDLLPMMTYIDGISACPRDGNYFSTIYWITRPENPWSGEWTGVDVARAGIFIDMPDKKGYITFTRQGIGRIGYDYGGYNADGHYQDVWYFYNINDLGAVALGENVVTSVLPDTYSTVQYPIPGRITSGACFDEETRMLYVYVMQSIPQQYGYKPIIHVYHLSEQSDSVTLVDQTFDQHADACFGAFQHILVAGDGNPVEFESGSKVNLIAGSSIQFLPGTYIREGANVHAYISTDGSFCDLAKSPIIETKPIAAKSLDVENQKPIKNESIKQQSIKVFPNPNNGLFTVTVEGLDQAAQLVVYNLLGTIVHQNIIHTEKTIDISDLQRGLYVVRIINKNELLSQKILIN
jgi:hypothetical protein